MNDLTSFLENSVYPIFIQRVPEAFPEFEFRKAGNKWISDRHLKSGEKSKRGDRDQTYILFDRHYLRDNNGDSESFIDYVMRSRGLSVIDSAKYLCQACGVELPEYDNEAFREYREKEEIFTSAQSLFTRALFDTSDAEATEVLSYLKGKRKWKEEEIRLAGLGYADRKTIESLSKTFGERVEGLFGSRFDAPSGAYIGFGYTHRLTIPYRSGSKFLGFKGRDIHVDGGLKYLNTTGLHRNSGLFGLPVNGRRGAEVVVVEGELDALHAQTELDILGADFSPVVATTGGKLTEEVVKDAMDKGYKRFNLLFDNDEAGRGFIQSADMIVSLGAKAYVSFIPEGCKDTDEYLRTHTIEEWEKEIAKAQPYYAWKVGEILGKYATKDVTFKDRENIIEDILALADRLEEPDRDVMFKAVSIEGKELSINADSLKAVSDRRVERNMALKQKKATEKALSDATKLAKDGKVDEALSLMESTAKQEKSRDKTKEWDKVFKNQTSEEIEAEFAGLREGLPTGFTFVSKKNGERIEEKLTLNTGLTFVCGNTGHGKTSFLNCLALNEAKRNIEAGNGKKVLYFSYEVNKLYLETDFLNAYINDKSLSGNPFKSILGCLKDRNDRFIREDKRTLYNQKKTAFMRDYLSTGALKIINETYKAEELLDAIRHYLLVNSVSVVFIDYAQLLYSESYQRQRTEEIKAIVNQIKDFANEVNIPFVLACQFNRQVSSPADVDATNIGEGGDFERIADTIIGLYNLGKLTPASSKDMGNTTKQALKNEIVEDYMIYKAIGGRAEVDTEHLTDGTGNADNGNFKPIEGLMYIRLLKRRYGYYPLSMLADWEGKTKVISPNCPEDLRTATEQDIPLGGISETEDLPD